MFSSWVSWFSSFFFRDSNKVFALTRIDIVQIGILFWLQSYSHTNNRRSISIIRVDLFLIDWQEIDEDAHCPSCLIFSPCWIIPQIVASCTPRLRLIFTFENPASCLFIIFNFSCKKKSFFFLGASVLSLIFLLGACHWSGREHTHLLAASADARLVHKYFSSTRDAALERTSSVSYTYYTVWYVFDGCGTYIWPHLILKIMLNWSLVMLWEDMVANYNLC